MKKLNLKSILGTAIVLSALANARAEIPKKVKKSKTTSAVVFKIQDRTNDQNSVSDGSKTEKTSK
ncbi:MAG: hypothetical protein HOP07_01155 [Bacteriovoracaceae bacterium]|nr:hypothetical protein [Bacteriovoracaceae bacterium]